MNILFMKLSVPVNALVQEPSVRDWTLYRTACRKRLHKP